VTVLGIAARNGIMLISHYRYLLPIVFGGIRPGQEIEHPMAMVIIGGLITSAVLNLFLLPVLYLEIREGPGRQPVTLLNTTGGRPFRGGGG